MKVKEHCEAQQSFAKENKAFVFAPHDGICSSCCKQIYEIISLERAKKELITGCPHCHRSFCD